MLPFDLFATEAFNRGFQSVTRIEHELCSQNFRYAGRPARLTHDYGGWISRRGD
jgi:Txe/YoeB family toxin of Txe-Axe toxin-antitoxin module